MSPAARRLAQLASSTSGNLLLAANCLQLAAAACTLLQWCASAWLLHSFWQQRDFNWPAAALLLLSLPLACYCSYSARRYALRAGHNCAAACSDKLLSQISAVPARARASYDAGALTSASTDLCEQIELYVRQVSAQSWYLYGWPLALTLLITFLKPELGAVLALTLASCVVSFALIGWLSKRAGDQQLAALTRLSGYFLNAVANLPTLKLWRQVKAHELRMRASAQELAGRSLAVLRLAFLSSAVLEWASFGLLAFAAWLLFLPGGWQFGDLLAFFLLLECFTPLRELGQGFHTRSYALAALERIEAIGTELAAQSQPASPGGVKVELERAPQLRVDNYPAASGAVWSFNCPAGTINLLRGPSGCGKSRMLQVLAGLSEAPSASITLKQEAGADFDLAAVAPERWREQVAYLSQQPILLRSSLSVNLKLAAPTAALEQICADLQISDFGAELLSRAQQPRIGSHSLALSGGELARVALARCLLKGSRLVLLDEPLQGLERWRREQIIARLPPYLQARTVIICSHLPEFEQLQPQLINLSA